MPEDLLIHWNETPDADFDNPWLNSLQPEKRAVVLALFSFASFVRGEANNFGVALSRTSESPFLRALIAKNVGTVKEAKRIKDAEPGQPMTVFAGRLVSGRTIDLIRTDTGLDAVLYHAEEVTPATILMSSEGLIDLCAADLIA